MLLSPFWVNDKGRPNSVIQEIRTIDMKEKMSRWGVGPIFASLSIGYGIIVLAISRHFYPTFQIPLLPKWLLFGLGAVLMLIGIPFFILSVKTVMKAYNSDSLQAISKKTK